MPLPFEKISKFEKDENGFMRVRVRFIAHGIMQYTKQELGDFAIPADPDGKIYDIFVGIDTISDPRAIRSLEGMPVVSDVHTWIDSDNAEVAVGSIAGTPKINGPFLEGEIVITDSKTIEAIEAGELSDISAAYRNSYIMGQGEHDGIIFDGKQTEIRYNHIALLSPGGGRGGREVRVLNSKKEPKMEFTSVQLGDSGQTVRVHSEDVQTLNAYASGAEKNKTSNAAHEATLEETMNNLEELRKTGTENDKQIEELTGQLAATKEQLENALNPETIEETANNIVQERDEAKKLIAENADEKDEEKTENSIKGLSGHKLRLMVVNTIRTANKRDALGKDDAESEGMVQGHYNALKDMAVATKNRKKTVNGADVARSQNSNGSENRRVGTAALGYAQPKEG